MVGLGGIVGGGILALAGVALANAGPSALLAFALNAILAILTAMSFAEMATAFPQSGGAYAYAKRVLPVQSAFAVGWVVWFASVVAGALYALGFAAYAILALSAFWPGATARGLGVGLAVVSVICYAALQSRPSKGGGQVETIGKMVLFVVLILAGLYALTRTGGRSLSPFFAGGSNGLLQAMGFSFIAFQGFDLIATVAGEVKEPRKNLPRSMIGSLVIAVIIYIPLLLIIALIGVPEGQTLVEFARAHPETMVALSAEQFMGAAGYWIVVVAAVLAMLSALQANLLAATRMAQSMASDRTLPAFLLDSKGALLSSAVMMILLVVSIPDVGTAGAAAGLVFLLSFALVHWCCILARQRGGGSNDGYRVPGYPVVPGLCCLACLALALFQGFTVPAAGLITALWLVAGAGLFLTTLAKKAQVSDAALEASDPNLVRLRGRSPFVLVPVANPQSASSMVALAHALAPPMVGRVLLLSVVPSATQVASAQEVIGEALQVCLHQDIKPEVLLTMADDPWHEISRVCQQHSCESLLLGWGGGDGGAGLAALKEVTQSVKCDVVIVRAEREWAFTLSRRILVPVGGRGNNDALRARLLNSLRRTGEREIQYLNFLPQGSSTEEVAKAEWQLDQLAADEMRGQASVKAVPTANMIDSLVATAEDFDLVVLGLQSGSDLLGPVVQEFASRSKTALVVLGRHR